jgi:hypothetical protein
MYKKLLLLAGLIATTIATGFDTKKTYNHWYDFCSANAPMKKLLGDKKNALRPTDLVMHFLKKSKTPYLGSDSWIDAFEQNDDACASTEYNVEDGVLWRLWVKALSFPVSLIIPASDEPTTAMPNGAVRARYALHKQKNGFSPATISITSHLELQEQEDTMSSQAYYDALHDRIPLEKILHCQQRGGKMDGSLCVNSMPLNDSNSQCKLISQTWFNKGSDDNRSKQGVWTKYNLHCKTKLPHQEFMFR